SHHQSRRQEIHRRRSPGSEVSRRDRRHAVFQTVSKKTRRKNPETRKEKPIAKSVIRYADAQVVIVEKPAGLTTMRHPDEAAEFGRRAGRFLPATLADLLPQLLISAERSKGPKQQRRNKRKPSSPVIPISHSHRRFFIRAVH